MSLEVHRAALEELQSIERALADRIARNPETSPHFMEAEDSLLKTRKKRSFREVLLQQHEMRRFMENYKRQKGVVESGSPDDFKELEDKTFELHRFDEMLSKIKGRADSAVVKGLMDIYSLKSSKINILSEVGSDIELSNMFSGEEYFGKYLDLIAFHERWLNLSVDKLSYVKYLEVFDNFETQTIMRKDGEYVRYLDDLCKYLRGYIKRTKPLFDLDAYEQTIKDTYSEEMGTGESNPLFCKACNKNFAKQTVYDAHLTGKKHLKNVQKLQTTTSSSLSSASTQTLQKAQGHKFLEYQIPRLIQVVSKERQDSKYNTERRRALTERERLIEMEKLEEEDRLSDDNSDDENDKHGDTETSLEPDFNPMNLPLGADGKPIPHWLYKLHGLDIEYTCEICTNHSYSGRKAFETHFLEARHVHGLKCLGISQPQKFKDITKISEAQELWEKIRKEEKQKEMEKENAVEVEDSEGNVMSEKVYNDLVKQGLI